jgi:hypothetical protein
VQGLGPRFALEVAFLIALAVGAGVAELSATWIVIVMALAWFVICLFELAVWAEGPRFPVLGRQAAPPAPDEAEPAAVTEIRQPEPPRRKRFWRRRRDGEAA